MESKWLSNPSEPKAANKNCQNQEYDANVPLSKKLSDNEIQTNRRWIKDQRNYSKKTGGKQYFRLNKLKTMKL